MIHEVKLFDDLDILRLGKQHFPGAFDKQLLAFGRSLRGIAVSHLPDLEQQAKDAARYKWLRGQFWVEEEARFRLNLIDTEYADVYHIALDESIDAAMKEQS